MKNKLQQAAAAITAQPNSQAFAKGNFHHEAAQTPAANIPPNFIIHHLSSSGYDRTARKTLAWFLNHWPGRRRRALVSFLVKTNQTFDEYNAFVLVNPRSITFRKTAAEVYKDALNWQMERPSYIRIWRSNTLTHYVCAPECDLYADYDGELWDSAGHLKQEVMDAAIRQLKAELLVGTETAHS